MRDGAVVGSFDQHAPITALAVSADGRRGADGRPRRQRRPLERAGRKAAPRAGGGAQGDHQGRVRTEGRARARRLGRHAAVRTYDAASGELVATLPHARRVRDAAFSADGRLVATTVEDSRIRIWDARTAESGPDARSGRLRALGRLRSDRDVLRVHRVRIARFGSGTRGRGRSCTRRSRPRAGSSPSRSGRAARLIADGRPTAWARSGTRATASLVGRMKHENGITDVEFDPTGDRIATASTDRTARVWAAKDGTSLSVLQGHDDTVVTVRFSADGRSLVTASTDGTARVWDVDDRPELRLVAMKGPAPPTLVATSPDGRTTARAVGRTVVLTGPSGTRVLRQHRDDVDSVAFSPDGSRLVTGSRDHDAIVFDVATGTLLHVLRIHSGTVTDAQFSPDSRWIVTAGPRTVGLWSAATGKFDEILNGPEADDDGGGIHPRQPRDRDTGEERRCPAGRLRHLRRRRRAAPAGAGAARGDEEGSHRRGAPPVRRLVGSAPPRRARSCASSSCRACRSHGLRWRGCARSPCVEIVGEEEAVAARGIPTGYSGGSRSRTAGCRGSHRDRPPHVDGRPPGTRSLRPPLQHRGGDGLFVPGCRDRDRRRVVRLDDEIERSRGRSGGERRLPRSTRKLFSSAERYRHTAPARRRAAD